MGLCINLERESGVVIKTVSDDQNLLHKLLPRVDGCLLSGIDWYGDTIFNGIQMKRFLLEWQETQKFAHSQDEADILSAIHELASSCESGTHLYLKFVGD